MTLTVDDRELIDLQREVEEAADYEEGMFNDRTAPTLRKTSAMIDRLQSGCVAKHLHHSRRIQH